MRCSQVANERAILAAEVATAQKSICAVFADKVESAFVSRKERG
jgi:hypothetical protein